MNKPAITILGRATSMNVQAVLWGLDELGLAFERRDYGHHFGGTDTPEFRAMNPNGLVPVMTDGEVTMFESGAILRYLAARHGRAPFWPHDPVKRAPVEMWAEWGKVTMQAHFTAPIFYPLYFVRAEHRNAAAVEAALRTFDADLAILEEQLGDRPYVTGDHFTLADIMIGQSLYRYFTMDIHREHRPVLSAYYSRLTDRPGYQRRVMLDYSSLKVHGA
ncbi:glutathione S-transferase family protein [Amaricoccus solimangrovi]|uniref:Glutathione S-transferase family protein n=1 Tax=Amaricoccus solimangrovi TaxID=2589815 RepID=A0A501WL15_9RHOB|nr:glutathione S-transferase family protein [Amaricoccus solimangrovi]TPE50443.1 glutathione S-transferase family protein [Amaricoccus solimangrovi]